MQYFERPKKLESKEQIQQINYTPMNETKISTNTIEKEDKNNKLMVVGYRFGTREYSCKDIVKLFFTSMAVCNECLLERDEDDNDKFNYTSKSPDEIALCNAARQFGVTLKKRDGVEAIVNDLGDIKEYTIEIVFEFDSERKCQSVITKYNGEYFLFVKGADSSVLNLLDPSIKQPYLGDMKDFLFNSSVQGLRTLCFAVRILHETEYKNIRGAYKEILTKANRAENLRVLAQKIEKNLVMIGASAIEDKLQDEVSECIEKFKEAGIKVWMITGDKLETAENISLACGISNLDMALFT